MTINSQQRFGAGVFLGLLYARYASIFALVLSLAYAVQILRQLRRGDDLDKGCLALVLCAGWAILHSIPIALTVFPEFRFTYANFLALSAGGLAWLAYFRSGAGSLQAKEPE